jgi:hypothetical protein
MVEAQTCDPAHLSSSLSLYHGVLLETTAQEWREYLESLSTQVDLLVSILKHWSYSK